MSNHTGFFYCSKVHLYTQYYTYVHRQYKNLYSCCFSEIMKNYIIGGAALYFAYNLLGNVGNQISSKLIFGDLAINDTDFHALNITIEMSLPIKNNSEFTLPFDGLDGWMEYKGYRFTDVKVLESIQIKAHEVSTVEISAKVYYTTLISLGLALKDEIVTMVKKKSFNGEVYLKGTAFSGQLKFELNNRIM